MILRGRNWWRLGAALALSAAVGVVLSPVAASDASSPQVTTQVLVTQSTYYWQGQAGAQNVGGTNVAPPTQVVDPTVPTGDVAVAGPDVNMQVDKETYLEFDVSAVPAGSTITSFVVTLPVDPSPQAQSFTPPTMAPPIIACTPQGAWSGGANGAQPLAGKPSDNCATDAPTFTSKDGGKTYTADIAAIAQGWLTNVNTGVAVADDPHNSNTAYQVVFGDSTALSKLTAQMTYTPGSNTTLNNPGANTFTPETTLPAEAATVPLVPSGVSSGVAPSSAAPTTTVPTGKGTKNALRATSFASAGPPGVFWVAAVLILALLFSASLVLGDEPVDEPRRGRRRLLLAGARQFHAGGPATPSKEA